MTSTILRSAAHNLPQISVLDQEGRWPLSARDYLRGLPEESEQFAEEFHASTVRPREADPHAAGRFAVPGEDMSRTRIWCRMAIAPVHHRAYSDRPMVGRCQDQWRSRPTMHAQRRDVIRAEELEKTYFE